MVVTFEQHDVGAGTRRCDRRGGSGRSAADDQHVAVAVHGYVARGFAQRAELGPVDARALALENVRDQEAFVGGFARDQANQQSKNTVSSRPCRITFHRSTPGLPATFVATSVARRASGTSASTGSFVFDGSPGK